MKRLLFLIILMAGLLPEAYAQPQYTSTNKGAIRSYEEATQFYDTYNFDKAREALLKAIANRYRLMVLCELHQGELAVSALQQRIAAASTRSTGGASG